MSEIQPARHRFCAKQKRPLEPQEIAFEINLKGTAGKVHLSPAAWGQACYILRMWLGLPDGDELIFLENDPTRPKIVSGTLRGTVRGSAKTQWPTDQVQEEGQEKL